MSEKYELYYARRTSIEPNVKYLRNEDLTFVLDAPFGQFMCIKYENLSPRFEENYSQEYSQKIGEVIYIGVQSNVDFFLYEHWKDGALLRRLGYIQDSWDQVDGTPEDWEVSVLFSANRLKELLEDYDEEKQATIRAAWERKQIQEGDAFPLVFAPDLMMAIENYFHLPKPTHKKLSAF
jgi:hypothetical protein